MDLRPRRRHSFTGFSEAEVEKMEKLFKESKEQTLEDDFCKKLARYFSRSGGRAGKPAVKWTEIQNWFLKKKELFNETSLDASGSADIREDGEKGEETLLFEARSTRDGAWYDVNSFLSHRFLGSGEIEVCVRFDGFGADEHEWVSVRDVRERSVALENSECQKLVVGDRVLCFREREYEAKYYDALIVEIQKRWHDIRGCRCRFLVRYIRDNFEETVLLWRLCCRGSVLARLE